MSVFVKYKKDEFVESGYVEHVVEAAEYTDEKQLCRCKITKKGFEDGYSITMKMAGKDGVLYVNNEPRMGWKNVTGCFGFGVYEIDKKPMACIIVNTHRADEDGYDRDCSFICSINYDEKYRDEDKIAFVSDEERVTHAIEEGTFKREVALEVAGHCEVYDFTTLNMVSEDRNAVFDEGLGVFVSM